jgi:hypothetical protein
MAWSRHEVPEMTKPWTATRRQCGRWPCKALQRTGFGSQATSGRRLIRSTLSRQPPVTCEKQFSFNCRYRRCVGWNQFKDLLAVLLA